MPSLWLGLGSRTQRRYWAPKTSPVIVVVLATACKLPDVDSVIAAEILSGVGQHFRVAMLVSRSSTEFGMARMQASLNDVLGLQTLILYEEARLVEGQPPLPARAPDART